MILGSQTIKCHVPAAGTLSKCIMRYADRLISLAALTACSARSHGRHVMPPPSFNPSIQTAPLTDRMESEHGSHDERPTFSPSPTCHFSLAPRQLTKQVWKMKTVVHISAGMRLITVLQPLEVTCFMPLLEGHLNQPLTCTTSQLRKKGTIQNNRDQTSAPWVKGFGWCCQGCCSGHRREWRHFGAAQNESFTVINRWCKFSLLPCLSHCCCPNLIKWKHIYTTLLKPPGLSRMVATSCSFIQVSTRHKTEWDAWNNAADGIEILNLKWGLKLPQWTAAHPDPPPPRCYTHQFPFRILNNIPEAITDVSSSVFAFHGCRETLIN